MILGKAQFEILNKCIVMSCMKHYDMEITFVHTIFINNGYQMLLSCYTITIKQF